jgi:hypothetical protein
MSESKGGKRPIADKANPYATFFTQKLLEVSAALKAELTAQGLEWRWINGQEYKENGGMHKDFWKPYIQKNKPVDEGGLGEWAGEASGVVRRKDLILGVRPKLMGDSHRAMLRHKAETYGQSAIAKAKQSVADAAREAGSAAFVPKEEE